MAKSMYLRELVLGMSGWVFVLSPLKTAGRKRAPARRSEQPVVYRRLWPATREVVGENAMSKCAHVTERRVCRIRFVLVSISVKLRLAC